MRFPSAIDVAIVGAGAAGIAAARTLEGSRLSILILEARDRLGGRGHTVTVGDGLPFDVGCEWLHSADRNAFVGIARELGFAITTQSPRWREQTGNLGFPAQDRAQFHDALAAFYARAEAAAAAPDQPASTLLEPGNRWNALIDAISTYINGCELDQVSVHDMDAYEDTEVNWRLTRGYGALIAAYGAPCPVAFDTAVTRIDHGGPRLRIETSRGTIEAGQAIITVPTNLIADEAIRFTPALPAKVAAAAGLPLGIADKVLLGLDRPEEIGADGHLHGATDRVGTGSYQLRPLGRPCVAGYFGGRLARELEDAGPGALAAHAIDELSALLGNDFRSRLTRLGESRWARDPFARGSYSHALPGHAGNRAVLAAPVDNRLFFAGEATSPNFFSTAHGARETGVRAAQELLRARS